MLLRAPTMEGREKFGPWDCQDASCKAISKEQRCLVGRACHWYPRDGAGFGLWLWVLLGLPCACLCKMTDTFVGEV